MFCTNCGAENHDDSKFCQSCGKEIKMLRPKDNADVISKEKTADGILMNANSVVPEIRDKKSLTDKQVSYIVSPSYTMFGPFAVLARNLWGIIAILFALSLLSGSMIKLAGETNDISPIQFDIFVMLPAYIWTFVIGYKNNRRWSWNCNKWKTFDDFVKSESDIWHVAGLAFFVVDIIILIVNAANWLNVINA